MPDKHAVLSASAAHRWLECTPCARLEETLPSSTSSYAEEGTRAHALCEKYLKELMGGKTEVLNFEPDDEMLDAAAIYSDFVEEELNAVKANTPDAKLFIEQQLDFGEYVPDGFGTSDAVIVGDDLLEVIDFKYGKGVPVDAEGNPQLRLYALGAYLALSSIYEFKRVKISVVQPRINNISSEELSTDELLDWAENVVKPRAALAYKGEGEYVTGAHCRFCKAAAVCRARVEKAFEIVEREHTKPPILSDEEIPDILDKLDETEAWIKVIREYAQNKAVKEGIKWRGYKLVESRTLRKITDQVGALKALESAGYRAEDVTNVKLKGLGDLEKILTKRGFNELLGKFVVKPQGTPTLVSINDKRPEITPLADAFNKED